MKAQHRKELHTNALADRLGRMVHALQNPQEGPSTTVLVSLGVVLVLVGCVVGWMWYDRHSKEVTSEENRKLDQAQSREDYKKLADAHPNTPAGRVARLQLARISLREGLDQLYSSKADERAIAQDNLKEARDNYAKLARECRDDPILAQECLMGEAKAKESLGDLDGALANYQTLLNEYKDGYLAQEAEEHKQQLEDPDKRTKMEKFYQELNGLAESKSPTSSESK